MVKRKYKLEHIKKEGKAFDSLCVVKPDAYSMPSRFYACTVFYPATADDTQTYYTQIQADIYCASEKVGTITKSDEFDTAREAKKWIEQVFEEFLKLAV